MNFVRLFKPEFADLVEAGAKRQTVRPTPKRMPQAGDTISLRAWTGAPYRSKQRILREATITDVQGVRLRPMTWELEIGGKFLWDYEIRRFAAADGFASLADFFRFFEENHGCGKFDGIVIYWS